MPNAKPSCFVMFLHEEFVHLLRFVRVISLPNMAHIACKKSFGSYLSECHELCKDPVILTR